MKRRSHSRSATPDASQQVAFASTDPPKGRGTGRPGRPVAVPVRWTIEECRRLEHAVETIARLHGLLRRTSSKWTAVARLVGTRSGAQCRRRWLARHAPGLDHDLLAFQPSSWPKVSRAKKDLHEQLQGCADADVVGGEEDDDDVTAVVFSTLDAETELHSEDDSSDLSEFPMEDFPSTNATGEQADVYRNTIYAHYGLLALEEYDEGCDPVAPTKVHHMFVGPRLMMGKRFAAPFVFGPPPPPPSGNHASTKLARRNEEAKLSTEQASITGYMLQTYRRVPPIDWGVKPSA